MPERTEEDCLRDALEAARRILSYTADTGYEDVLGDIKTQDAVVRNIEIMGEATGGIPEEFRSEHIEVPWRSIGWMRDKLIHGYFGVNIDIVWGIVVEDLPRLVGQIGRILSDSDRRKKQ